MRDVDMEILEVCRRAKDPARAYKLAFELISEVLTRSEAGESDEEIEKALALKYGVIQALHGEEAASQKGA